MAEIKDKKAMINNGEDIELDGVTVINKGVSLGETKKEEPKVETASVVTEDPIIPENAIAAEVPTEEPILSPIDIPVAPVAIPEIGNTEVSQVDVPILPTENPVNYPAYETPVASSTNFMSDKVFKNASDVEQMKNGISAEIASIIDQYMTEPTKALVALVNDYNNWGKKVTSRGLNRELLEEYDELCGRYEGMKTATYNDEEPNVNIGENNYFGGMAA